MRQTMTHYGRNVRTITKQEDPALLTQQTSFRQIYGNNVDAVFGGEDDNVDVVWMPNGDFNITAGNRVSLGVPVRCNPIERGVEAMLFTYEWECTGDVTQARTHVDAMLARGPLVSNDLALTSYYTFAKKDYYCRSLGASLYQTMAGGSGHIIVPNDSDDPLWLLISLSNRSGSADTARIGFGFRIRNNASLLEPFSPNR